MSQKQDEATMVALQKMKDLGVDLDRYLESLALSQAGASGSSACLPAAHARMARAPTLLAET